MKSRNAHNSLQNEIKKSIQNDVQYSTTSILKEVKQLMQVIIK